jgi:hypothetical protein
MAHREEWFEQAKLAELLDKWLILGAVVDRDRSCGGLESERCNAQEARGEARRARCPHLVSREIDHDRVEIAPRALQSVAAYSARAAPAGGR